MKPLAIDLFCGLGGWSEGLIAEGFYVVGFDIEQHEYNGHRYPGHLVIQDVLTLHGAQFRDATLIVASPPCQKYSYMSLPWTSGRVMATTIRADKTGQMLADLNRLFDVCFRIQREASLAADRHIPMIVENVRGAIPWVGRSRWNYGPFHLWGDVPAVMPYAYVKKTGGSWCWQSKNYNPRQYWNVGDKHGKRPTQKQAAALIAKIPLPLARYIARTFYPRQQEICLMDRGAGHDELTIFAGTGVDIGKQRA